MLLVAGIHPSQMRCRLYCSSIGCWRVARWQQSRAMATIACAIALCIAGCIAVGLSVRCCCCCCMLVARCRLGSFLFLTSSLACLHRCPSAVVVVVAADVAAGWAWCNTRIEFAAVMLVGGLILRRAVGVLLPDWRLEIVTMLDRRSGAGACPVKKESVAVRDALSDSIDDA